jgi:hypothetical protein
MKFKEDLVETHLAPTWMPLGHELTKSTLRRPWPASARHMPGKPRRGIPLTMPGQLVFDEETPAVRLSCLFGGGCT